MNRIVLLSLFVGASAFHGEQQQRPYKELIEVLKDHLSKHRELQSGNGNGNGLGPGGPNNGLLTCDTLNEAFDQPAWANSTCSCRGQGSFEVSASCIDNFECCTGDNGVCVTNSFEQIINRETYNAVETTEYFHYTRGRIGTITLYHICDGPDCTCSLHLDTDRCASCEWITCDGEEAPLFDCTNLPGGAVFDYCPYSEVHGLDTETIFGALEDGYVDYIDNCRPLPSYFVPFLGGLHELHSRRSDAFGLVMSYSAAALSVFMGYLFL